MWPHLLLQKWVWPLFFPASIHSASSLPPPPFLPPSLPQLSLSEEDVWRAVIQWGQHHASISQTMLLWTEADRAKMKDQLAGVLEHVRVMNINSEVFANEVEPTGLLPMEMTLAR